MAAHRGRRRASAAPFPDPDPASPPQPQGLEEEVEMLRSTIRELAKQKDFPEARRQIDTLCRVLRTRYLLDDHAVDSLAEALLRSLEEDEQALGVEP